MMQLYPPCIATGYLITILGFVVLIDWARVVCVVRSFVVVSSSDPLLCLSRSRSSAAICAMVSFDVIVIVEVRMVSPLKFVSSLKFAA